MILLALDPSLTSTGYVLDLDGDVTRDTYTPPGRGVRRLSAAERWLTGLILEHDVEFVVIEGYSYGSRGRAVVSIGEFGGVLRLAMHELGVPFVEIPPSVLKKYATGKGNAAKEKVLVEAVKRLGYTGSSTDEADALWLHQIALALLGLHCVDVPKSHMSALKKVELPKRVAAPSTDQTLTLGVDA